MPDKEVSDDGVGHHSGIVRYIASLKNYKGDFVEFREDSNFIDGTLFRQKTSIDKFVNVSDKVCFHDKLRKRKFFLENVKTEVRFDSLCKTEGFSLEKERKRFREIYVLK
jgi:hypothetical protein